eukprot:6503765-Prymnesium_polylepis.1
MAGVDAASKTDGGGLQLGPTMFTQQRWSRICASVKSIRRCQTASSSTRSPNGAWRVERPRDSYTAVLTPSSSLHML